jgi:protein O-GlcNAc transferase
MAQLTIQQAYELALQHHRAGRLHEAENLYQQILTRQPGHIDALHFLGVIAHQTGRNDLSVELISRAIALHPNFPAAHLNLGISLRDNGKLDEAIAAFHRAIGLRPDFPEAFSNLGIALMGKGQTNEALAAFRNAIAQKSDYLEAHFNLGIALKETGQLDAAITALSRAIALRPDYAEAFTNLGNALIDKGRLDDAIAALAKAAALRPDSAEAHSNLGHALKLAGQFDAAIAAYRKALVFNPNLPGVHSNLGNALRDAGQLDEAIAAFGQAIALDPNYAEAHNNLGNALKDAGRLDEAVAEFRRAIALKPDYPEAHSNLVYTLQYHPGYDARAIAEESRCWSRRHADPLQPFIPAHANTREPDRRLRIGYVSADFRNHASAHFLLPLLKHHDARQVEVFCYAQVVRPDAMTLQLQRHAHVWRHIVGVPDDQVAKQVREDRIDILVDLKVHTAENRLPLFARKPAPIQVTWLGNPGTTGLTTMDYRLTDPYLDPPAVSPVQPPGMDESVYSERTIRLPDTFWCYDPLDGRDIPVNSLPALRSGVFTFGCLNNFCKINDDVLALWAKVLRQIENSRLLLLAPMGSHRLRALERFKQDGIDPDRIEFISQQSRRNYLETYHRIDLALDTFPCGGHTTSLDSFWMGVPLITLVRNRVFGRAGWSQLSNLGLAELAGQTPDQYVNLAVELARDLPRLEQLRSTLRRRMEQSPLMDAPKFARAIEAAYRRMWHTWCESSSTES